MIRIWTGAAAQLGTCDHCEYTHAHYRPQEADLESQVITAVTLHRENSIVFLARFCEKHFLQFCDLVSDQVAALLYPPQKGR